MKKIVFILLFLFAFDSHAQKSMFAKDPIINLENFDKQRVHWGYFLGFNSLDFKFDSKLIKKKLKIEIKGFVSCGINPSIPAFLKSTGSGVTIKLPNIYKL